MGEIIFGVDRYGDREQERLQMGISQKLDAFHKDIVEVELFDGGWVVEDPTGYVTDRNIGVVVQPVRYGPVPRWCHL